MAKLDLVFEPNEILHVNCQPVKIVDQDIKQLSLDMAETMLKENGVGLAAPQIGKAIRMFVVAHKNGPITMINPEIYWNSQATTIEEEGCLSIPGVFGKVCRFKEIKVKYLDENGQEQDLHAKNFLARVIQHEEDHLNGILILDRFES